MVSSLDSEVDIAGGNSQRLSGSCLETNESIVGRGCCIDLSAYRIDEARVTVVVDSSRHSHRSHRSHESRHRYKSGV